MTLIVEVGLVRTEDYPPDVMVLGSTEQGIIGTNTVGDDPTYVDYSDRVMSVEVDHRSSRNGPLVEYDARTCSVVLRNDDGQLDPAAIEADGLAAPGTALRIRKVHGNTTYDVFTGFVDSWLPGQTGPLHGYVTVTGSDAFSLLNWPRRPLVSPVGAGETTGQRVNRVLDAAGWPDHLRVIAGGDTFMGPTDLSSSALDELQDAALVEGGELYVRPDGCVFFRNRRAMLVDVRSTTSQVTFGSDRAGGELPYVDRPVLSWDRNQMINEVVATRDGVGAVAQTATDVALAARYGLRSTAHTININTDGDALDWARWVLHQHRTPRSDFTEMQVECILDPDTYLPEVLGRRFGDRVTVVRRPPGGVVDAREVLIRSVSHRWSASRPLWWSTTFGLQDADRWSFMVIGHPRMGRIGRNALAW